MKIEIRQFKPQPSKLIIVDVDGNTKEFFDNKEELIGYVARLIIEELWHYKQELGILFFFGAKNKKETVNKLFTVSFFVHL